MFQHPSKSDNMLLEILQDQDEVRYCLLFIVVTVNVVIFAEGKFCEDVGKTFHVGVIFTILLIFPS